jgi:hypothetical protein
MNIKVNPFVRIDEVFALDLDKLIEGWQHELCFGTYLKYEVRWSGFVQPVNQDCYVGWWAALEGPAPVEPDSYDFRVAIVSPILGPVQELRCYDVIDTTPQIGQVNLAWAGRALLVEAAKQQMVVALDKLTKYIDAKIGG